MLMKVHPVLVLLSVFIRRNAIHKVALAFCYGTQQNVVSAYPENTDPNTKNKPFTDERINLEQVFFVESTTAESNIQP